MSAIILQKVVGPWPMNSYMIGCDQTKKAAIIDPGADASNLLRWAEEYTIIKILVTHGHPDHVGALDQIEDKTGTGVYMNPIDAEIFKINYDFPLTEEDPIRVGELLIKVVYTPGHTPGMTSFFLDDNRAIVGDTLFVGGPGKTWAPEDFSTTMKTMNEVVFNWPDDTIFFPGHGSFGVIGLERPAYETFVKKGWPPELFGDVTWDCLQA